MKITRLRVEEGFFDGLDLSFSSGLNVIIGGRGVGKTSIIELIRFALGVQGSYTHATSVLQSGQVTVDLENNGFSFSVARSTNDPTPRSGYQFVAPIVYSQKEIESVGLDAAGRLSLIDDFFEPDTSYGSNLNNVIAQINSVTVSILNIHKSIEESSGLDQVEPLKTRELQLLENQRQFSLKNAEVESFQKDIDVVYSRTAELNTLSTYLDAFIGSMNARANILNTLNSDEFVKSHNVESAKQLVGNIFQDLKNDDLVIQTLIDKTLSYRESVQELRNKQNKELLDLDARGRDLRAKVNQFNEGAGAISRELGAVRQKIAQLEAAFASNKSKVGALNSLFDTCENLVGRLTELRLELFQRRCGVAVKLNEKLKPFIKVDVDHLFRLDDYKSQLEQALRGSGLKYKELIPLIVKKISPQELFSFVRNNSFTEFSNVLGITPDRGARIVGFLRDSNLGPILCSAIEDDVRLMLMDGSGYKVIDELSIGQRCTVALSIVLENTLYPLLIDQPEDHLDNEFVAGTLINALVERSKQTQTIVCTHNANIPVLGEAQKVVCLDSNGRKGFIKKEGQITSPEIRSIIETVMEGGKQAFSIRAKFYG